MISAAQECMREKGLHATRVTEIAKRAGVSVGLLYHLFPNKDALIEAMMDANVEATLEQASARFAGESSNLYDFLAITSTPVDSLSLETLAEVWRHQNLGGRMKGKQRETFTRIRDFATSLFPDDRETDLDIRIRLITAINFGVGTVLAVEGSDGNQRIRELGEIIGRAIADRSTVDFGALFSG
jgi:AcrR family transcriptional regulator